MNRRRNLWRVINPSVYLSKIYPILPDSYRSIWDGESNVELSSEDTKLDYRYLSKGLRSLRITQGESTTTPFSQDPLLHLPLVLLVLSSTSKGTGHITSRHILGWTSTPTPSYQGDGFVYYYYLSNSNFSLPHRQYQNNVHFLWSRSITSNNLPITDLLSPWVSEIPLGSTGPNCRPSVRDSSSVVLQFILHFLGGTSVCQACGRTSVTRTVSTFLTEGYHWERSALSESLVSGSLCGR